MAWKDQRLCCPWCFAQQWKMTFPYREATHIYACEVCDKPISVHVTPDGDFSFTLEKAEAGEQTPGEA